MSTGVPLRFDLGRLEESTAVVRISLPNDGELTSAVLYGPQCEVARTLPAETRFKRPLLFGKSASSLVATVMEPCYWTPEIPFLYELRAEYRDGEGSPHSFSRRIGLRRWWPQHRSFYLSGRRRVLRGVWLQHIMEHDVMRAKPDASALIGPQPAEEILDVTDRVGAALIIDFRDDPSPVDVVARLEALAWRPSVFAVLFDQHQLLACSDLPRPEHLPLFVAVYPGSPFDPSLLIASRADAIVVEWEEVDPGPVLAAWKGPAIVLSREEYETMRGARASCTRVQKLLAPEFDLAGYFVEGLQ